MLWTKYRPKSYNEVIGNTAIKKSLFSELSSPFFEPVMFIGPKGTGKTTFSYIYANQFGASSENIEDVNCVYFSKKDDIESILKDFKKSSLFGTKKVLILDEIHEMSPKAQQVLLKPLENLSEDELVLACTTTREKIKDALLSRFKTYYIRPLSFNDSLILLDNICSKEDIKLSKPVKKLLIESSEGIPRQLLTNLSKINGISDIEEIKYLLEVTSLEDDVDILELFKVLNSNQNWNIVKNVLKKLLSNKSPNDIRVGLMNMISGNIMSSWYKPDRQEFMLEAYKYLKTSCGFPEKANLIMAINYINSLK